MVDTHFSIDNLIKKSQQLELLFSIDTSLNANDLIHKIRNLSQVPLEIDSMAKENQKLENVTTDKLENLATLTQTSLIQSKM